ncbi:MAG TPA: type III pantothenate kinase [Rhodocyclaceae bacterium]|nr:type III pantothenate kinase [Rhodocyclaceae bacterium]HNA04649.1 type III pantothenate kinase [Rhodocyclaceae bacterium]HNB78132.1 type III pantothenate kinase [Rhodocyclaceae bacterium]HNC60583.1 type III pantothenate kinase [Rhodocyclaceae bacterium]HNH98710.1 type III pantothenate kinase [Rhodocyclaceae bacterium]
MILCIDAGNTRIKWGVATSATGPWLAQGAVLTAAPQDLPNQLPGCAAAGSALVCSVAGDQIDHALAKLLESRGIAISWLRAGSAAFGVRNDYRNPAQLGADRWAALIGARGLHRGPVLVVMAGTATTIDVLDASGCFRGGFILPGFDLMRSALARNTAQLPLAEAEPSEFPRSTDEAIVSGCLAAQAGAVDRMFRRIAAEPHACCLLSGGGAQRLASVLDLPLKRVDNLTLEGLRRAAFEGADPEFDR